MKSVIYFLASWCLLVASPVSADSEPGDETLQAWFEDDSELRALAVNEGQLIFLKPPADRSRLYTENRLDITEQSLVTGWVGLKQCHYNLDPVPQLDIVYTYVQMENLQIVSIANIEKAKVVKQSVQLENVMRSASLCITADVRVLYQNDDNYYSLRNGPYYRKFLDGYYPYNVIIEINYPDSKMGFISSKPEIQEGFDVINHPGQIIINAWFDGVLKTEMLFRLKQ